MYAGSPSVLSTLWSVNDEATAYLMTVFYENLRQMDKAEALRRAQLRTKERYPHPFFWGAFVLNGDWE
jgi:CHAT domain-containing protein